MAISKRECTEKLSFNNEKKYLMSAVSVQKINKSYKQVKALNDISFEAQIGEIFGIIGPDGAGKTTLFRILTTLLLADSGTATIDGDDIIKDYKKIRQKIGYMPGKFSLYQDLTIEENLNFFATIFNTTLEENYYLIEDIYRQIEPFKKRHAGKLSGGMKQKLALCCALVHKPTVLFLDEPTTGIDPVSRKELWEMLKKLRTQNISIIVSTPYMDEASLCDRIAFIQDGRFFEIDTPQNIINKFPSKLWAVEAENMPHLLRDLRKNEHIKSCFSFGENHHVTVDDVLTIDELKKSLMTDGHTRVDVHSIEPTIEDCFMQITERKKYE